MSRPPPQSRRVKLALSSGYVAAQGPQNVVHVLSHQVLNITFGLSPLLINLLVCVQRLWGAVLDPLVGQASDALRTRFGRRRPLLAVAALPLAIGFAGLWLFPARWSHGAVFAYCLALSLLLYTALSVYGVALGGLQLDVADDYHQRTRLAGLMQIAFLVFTVGVQWLYPLMQHGGDPVERLHGLALALAAFFLVAALAPVLLVRERPVAATRTGRDPERLPGGVRSALRSDPFLRLVTATGAANLGFYLASIFGVYLNYYYIFPGRTGAASVMQGWLGTAFQVSAIAAIVGFRRLSRRTGKRRALQFAAACHLVAGVAKLTLYRPDWPWLQVPIYIANGAAFAGVSLLSVSMVADVAEYEAWKTGCRREGLHYAVLGWADKMCAALGTLVCGIAFPAIGFKVTPLAAQSATTLWQMQLLYALFPALGGIVAIVALWGYPLSEEAVATVKQALAANPVAATDSPSLLALRAKTS